MSGKLGKTAFTAREAAQTQEVGRARVSANKTSAFPSGSEGGVLATDANGPGLSRLAGNYWFTFSKQHPRATIAAASSSNWKLALDSLRRRWRAALMRNQ